MEAFGGGRSSVSTFSSGSSLDRAAAMCPEVSGMEYNSNIIENNEE